MAAFGVMAALHERRRSGEGQMVDVSMADGALSWLALVAGRYFCDGEVPRRGEQQLAGGCSATCPTRRRRLGHLRRPRAEVLGRLLQRGRAPD
jgi:crotonobetainyl-CoA:carnitine CoA-transferase CaiB-like acyl-CoA transferase